MVDLMIAVVIFGAAALIIIRKMKDMKAGKTGCSGCAGCGRGGCGGCAGCAGAAGKGMPGGGRVPREGQGAAGDDK